MKIRKLLLTFCWLLAAWPLAVLSQNANDSNMVPADSLAQLQAQVQELSMQRILLQEQLERSGQNARTDSMLKVQRKYRIDSLKRVTKGSPLIVDGDTLFIFFAKKGGMLPETRAKEAKAQIEALGRRLTFGTDSVYVYEGDFSSDVMAGDIVIISITDMDGLWQNKPRAQLAAEYATVIQAKIDELHSEYGLQQKLWGIFWALLIIVIQYICIKLTNRLFEKWKFRFTRLMMGWMKPIRLKDYEFLDTHRQGIAAITIYKWARLLFIGFQLVISITALFFIFPETKTIVFVVLGYIWNPFKDIILSFFGYLPNLFKIAVIYFCFRYLVRGVKYFADEIASGHLKLNGFYADWASPTYFILRTLLYSLMFVMIWPLLPNSNSEIFQGVSVFIGIIISLGSTSIIGNLMAGMVMTYMRPFRIGDYIKVGDTVGEVIEKTVLVTRIRTRKNEVVTIQNSSLMGSQSSNYTVAAENYGIIVHTKVTIGYDVPWQQIKEIMESAALETKGIKKTPHPFMMTTSLDDFYVEYEINAYTNDAVNLPRIYSELHQKLLQKFFEGGVEIMSPHIYARRDGIDVQMPPEYAQKQ